MIDKSIFDLDILIVDDLEDNILLIEGILEMDGFNNIHSALNGYDAIDYIKNNKIDLVILDITMPELDGISVCKHIRQELKLDDIMILLATAQDDLKTLKIGLEEAGANDYVRKSFDNDIELLSRIKNLLLHKLQINLTKDKEIELENTNSILVQQHKELQTLNNLVDKYIITSKTDTKGIITHASKAFIDICGYSKKELLGQPHNIVRHPDMTSGVFKNMWETIAAGKTWRGEVKNLKKDGGFYWVDAIISADYDHEGNIIGYSAIRLDITSQKEAKHLAYHDFLTSLPNKARFQEISTHALNIAKRDNTSLAVLFLDFDKFKNINDTLGHHVGDEMLKIVSTRMQSVLREVDTVARIGGDEFVILLESIQDMQAISTIIDKIEHIIKQPMEIFDHTVYTSASIGVSIYPHDGNNIDTLMKNADNAMYHAKESGRSNYKFFTEKINTTLTRTVTIENALRDAIKNDSFKLVYQPKYNLQSHKCRSCEVLLRLRDKKLGNISPLEFIPIAEENKMIIEIGDIVLKKACKALKNWKEMNLDIDLISINISSIQLEQKGVVKKFKKIVEKNGLQPHNIELELTEYSIVKNLEKNVKTLQKLTDLGFKISIDDFGTGYSSMSYLKKLPIDTIKIDKAFIDDIISSNQNDFAIAHAIIQLSRDLEFEVIAEGIETKLQEEVLISLNCEFGQGFAFSKGLANKKFIKFLEKYN